MTMHRFLLLLITCSSVLSCVAARRGPASTAPDEPAFPVIETTEYRGAIVPEDYLGRKIRDPRRIERIIGIPAEGYWTPTRPDIERAEACISRFLKASQVGQAGTDGAVGTEVGPSVPANAELLKIAAHVRAYGRQYIGLIQAGNRRVLCNLFPTPLVEDMSWRHHIVVVDDGGFWYWRIVYDPSDDTCDQFSSNGYA
jgi:hypothetical protein